MKKKLGLVTGSFDPITVGHLDIIARAARLFEQVIVVVADNEEKTYMFTSEQRTEIAKAAVVNLENVTVKSCSGYVADFAAEHLADAFVRGIRGGDDVEYEQRMADVNFKKCGVDTVLLFAKPEYHLISSTAARSAINEGKSFAAFVPENAVALIYKYLQS